MDLLLLALAIVLLVPVLLLVATAVRIALGRPIVFRQLRPGLSGRPFQILKFRSMLDVRDEQGRLLPDEQRLTSFGHWLRRTSLDELPELWNVVRGEMSLVGPRPLLIEYLDRYTPEQSRRHEVQPGISGWAQVNGRNSLTWEEKFALDVWYVDNWSLWLDCKILWMTLLTVVNQAGIRAPNHPTMPQFQGTRESNS